MTDRMLCHSLCFCHQGNGKIKGSISKIFTSMWKPWSYLEGSRDGGPSKAEGADRTTDGPTTYKGPSLIRDSPPANKLIHPSV